MPAPGLLLPARALSQLRTLQPGHSKPTEHASGDVLVLFDVVAPGERLSNSSLSGGALFRRRLVESLVLSQLTSAGSSGRPELLPHLVAAGKQGAGQACIQMVQVCSDVVRGATAAELAAALQQAMADL